MLGAAGHQPLLPLQVRRLLQHDVPEGGVEEAQRGVQDVYGRFSSRVGRRVGRRAW